MAFRLGDIAEKKQDSVLTGIQREVACDCWFTSGGKTMPRMIKLMDEQGVVQTVREIHLLFSEEKMYSGIRTVEHICSIVINDRKEMVKLIYTKENCQWSIVKIE